MRELDLCHLVEYFFTLCACWDELSSMSFYSLQQVAVSICDPGNVWILVTFLISVIFLKGREFLAEWTNSVDINNLLRIRKYESCNNHIYAIRLQ